MILLVGRMYIHTYTSPIGIHTLGICKWGSGSSIHDDDTQDLQTHPIDSKDPEYVWLSLSLSKREENKKKKKRILLLFHIHRKKKKKKKQQQLSKIRGGWASNLGREIMMILSFNRLRNPEVRSADDRLDSKMRETKERPDQTKRDQDRRTRHALDRPPIVAIYHHLSTRSLESIGNRQEVLL